MADLRLHRGTFHEMGTRTRAAELKLLAPIAELERAQQDPMIPVQGSGVVAPSSA